MHPFTEVSTRVFKKIFNCFYIPDSPQEDIAQSMDEKEPILAPKKTSPLDESDRNRSPSWQRFPPTPRHQQDDLYYTSTLYDTALLTPVRTFFVYDVTRDGLPIERDLPFKIRCRYPSSAARTFTKVVAHRLFPGEDNVMLEVTLGEVPDIQTGAQRGGQLHTYQARRTRRPTAHAFDKMQASTSGTEGPPDWVVHVVTISR
jgi:hypothetical protein